MRGQVLSADPMTLTQIFLQRVKIMKLTKSHYITILTLPNSASYAIQSRKRFSYNTINNIDSTIEELIYNKRKVQNAVECSILFARKPVRLE